MVLLFDPCTTPKKSYTLVVTDTGADLNSGSLLDCAPDWAGTPEAERATFRLSINLLVFSL